jgi:prevent-host-death family protein
MAQMEQVLPTEPISKFRQSQNEILDMLGDGPVVLTHHGVSAGVLLSVTQYNSMVKLIRRYDDTEIILKRLREMDQDDSSWQTLEEFDAALRSRGLIYA